MDLANQTWISKLATYVINVNISMADWRGFMVKNLEKMLYLNTKTHGILALQRFIHKEQTGVNALKKYGYKNIDNTIAEKNFRKRYHCLVSTPSPKKPSKKTQMKTSKKKTPTCSSQHYLPTQFAPRPTIPSPRPTPRQIIMSLPWSVLTSPQP